MALRKLVKRKAAGQAIEPPPERRSLKRRRSDASLAAKRAKRRQAECSPHIVEQDDRQGEAAQECGEEADNETGGLRSKLTSELGYPQSVDDERRWQRWPMISSTRSLTG